MTTTLLHHTIILVDGGVSTWSKFTTCSTSCGLGKEERTRSCTNPQPQHGGKDCEEDLKESRDCNLKPCPGILLLYKISNGFIEIIINFSIRTVVDYNKSDILVLTPKIPLVYVLED